MSIAIDSQRRLLFSFQASATGGLGSVKAEVMADTAVALASANVQVVSRKVIGRLDSVRHGVVLPLIIGELKRSRRQLSKDDWFYEQNNSSTRASRFLVDVYDVHCSTTT